MNYVVYLRKSTDSDDRQVQSIDDQMKELRHLIERRSLNVVKEFSESQSAKAPGRPEFNRMMDYIKAGKAQGIICWAVNRLSRNPMDGGEIQWLLQEGTLQAIVTPNGEYRTGDNVLVMSVELGVANQFVLDLGKGVKRGMHSKAEKGWRPGPAPLGYKNDKGGDQGAKVIHVDDEKFPLVRRLWDLLLTGRYTVAALHRIANEDLGLRTNYGKRMNKLSLSSLHRIFSNPFYYGEYYWTGELHRGLHTPMITTDEFDLAQKILGVKGKPRQRRKSLPFRGLIRCGECGSLIVLDEKVKHNKFKGVCTYHFARCMHHKANVKCSQKQISLPALESQILEVIEKISIPEAFVHFAVEILNKENDAESSNRDIRLRNHRSALKGVETEIQNLLKLYISPSNTDKSLLSEENYRETMSKLSREKERLRSQISSLETQTDEWIELTEKTFVFATHAKYWFENGTFEDKTAILRAIGSNFTLKDRKLAITFAKPFQILSEYDSTRTASVELPFFVDNKAKTASSEAVLAHWSG